MKNINGEDLVKGNNVIGLKVVTVNEGKKVGEVKDLIYDPDEHTVKALLLDEGGWFSDAKVILIENIQSIGDDAVIIPSVDAVKQASDVTTPVANIARDDQYLTRTKIVTEEGTDLGSVTDIYFYPNTGKVLQFEVSGGIFKKMGAKTKRFSVSDIITVGKDATIVKSYIEKVIAHTARELRTDIKDKIEEEKLKDILEQQAIKARLKVHEIAEDVKNRYQSAGVLGGKSKHERKPKR